MQKIQEVTVKRERERERGVGGGGGGGESEGKCADESGGPVLTSFLPVLLLLTL